MQIRVAIAFSCLCESVCTWQFGGVKGALMWFFRALRNFQMNFQLSVGIPSKKKVLLLRERVHVTPFSHELLNGGKNLVKKNKNPRRGNG